MGLLSSVVSLLLIAQSTGTIRGVVVNAQDGEPVRRVSVRLQSDPRMAVTDERGCFELTDVREGEQELTASAVGFLLVKRTVLVPAGASVDVTVVISDGTSAYTETVDVRGLAPMTRREPALAAERTLGSTELQQLRGLLTNDPLRAVQILPGVTAGDDFRSEFAVRGIGVQGMTFTFEGISTPFLLHTVQQVHDGGSVAMVNGDVLGEVSLLSGAFPQRHGNRVGAELDFRLREGSRERTQSHISVSAIDASVTAEGPIGRPSDDGETDAPGQVARPARGSWLASARKSYLDLIVDRLYPQQNLSFGFADTQARLVYDASPRHQLQLAFTGGRSRLERPPDRLGAGNLKDADNQSAMAVLTWRYVPSPRVTLTQRVSAIENGFRNLSRDGAELDSGNARDAVYRAEVVFAPSRTVLVETGGEARWSSGSARQQRLVSGQLLVRESYDASATAVSAYAQVRWASSGGVSVTPGLRVDRRSLVGRTTASPWALALWPVARRISLRAGGGLSQQEPGFAERLGTRGNPALLAERAYHADLGVEGSIGATGRWQVTGYDREDRNALRLPDAEMRVVNGALALASVTSRYQSVLDGRARGVEWLLQRQSPNGFSGWASYAFGTVTARDRTTGESFAGDFDQRHTVSLYGSYRVNDRLSVSARFRYGSNFPTTGYWESRDGGYYVSNERNTLRVPAYSRLDVRANRAFTWDRARVTLFLEAINVYNRTNVRFALPSVNRRTFEATNLYESMAPLIPSFGVLIEF